MPLNGFLLKFQVDPSSNKFCLAKHPKQGILVSYILLPCSSLCLYTILDQTRNN